MSQTDKDNLCVACPELCQGSIRNHQIWSDSFSVFCWGLFHPRKSSQGYLYQSAVARRPARTSSQARRFASGWIRLPDRASSQPKIPTVMWNPRFSAAIPSSISFPCRKRNKGWEEPNHRRCLRLKDLLPINWRQTWESPIPLFQFSLPAFKTFSCQESAYLAWMAAQRARF